MVDNLRIHDLFPARLPYDYGAGKKLAEVVTEGRIPKEDFCFGKSLEFVLFEHIKKFTDVIHTDESQDSRWWDGFIPALNLRIDCKLRRETSKSYTLSDAEWDQQFKKIPPNTLFIWAFYVQRDEEVHFEGAFARMKGSDLDLLPAPTDSFHKSLAYEEPKKFWWSDQVKTADLMYLDQIHRLKLVDLTSIQVA